MQARTWETVLGEIKQEMDLEDEGFIKDSELMAAANRMIRYIEGTIVTLNDNYLMLHHDFTLAANVDTYDLPTNLFAQKIIYILFTDKIGTKTGISKGEPWECVQAAAKGRMHYEILNTAWNTGNDIKFYGLPTYDSSQTLKMWYIREITRITSINSYVNLPEFENLIALAVKQKIAEKEKNPLLTLILQDIADEKRNMITAITNQAPDGLNIEPDVSFYDDFNGGVY